MPESKTPPVGDVPAARWTDLVEPTGEVQNDTAQQAGLVLDKTADAPVKIQMDRAARLLESVTRERGAGDLASFSEMAKKFESEGVYGAGELFSSPQKWYDANSRAEAESLTWLQNMGFGEAVSSLTPEARNRMKASFKFRKFVSLLPPDPNDSADTAGAVIRTMLDDRIAQIKSDVRPGAEAEVANMEQAAEKLKAQSNESLLDLVHLGVYYRHNPRNSEEEKLVETIAASAHKWRTPADEAPSPMALAAETHLVRSAMTGAPVEASTVHNPSLLTKAALLQGVYGDAAFTDLVNRFNNETEKKNLQRMGHDVDPSGRLRPGYFDGTRFVEKVPPEVAQILAGQIAPAAAEAIQRYNGDLEVVRRTWGEQHARRVAAANLTRHAADTIEVANNLVGVAPATTEEGLTPSARRELGVPTTAALDLLGFAGKLWTEARLSAASVDKSLVNNVPFIRKMAENAAFAYTGQAELRDTVRTLSDAVGYAFRNATLNGTRHMTPEQAAALRGATPEVMRELFLHRTTTLTAAMEEYFKSGYEGEAMRQRYLAGALRGTEKRDWAKTVEYTLASTLFNIWATGMKTATTLADNPAEGTLYLAGTALGERAGIAGQDVKAALYNKVFLGSTVRSRYLQLLKSAPQDVLESTRRAIRRAQALPLDADRIASLQGIIGGIESRLEDVRLGRQMNVPEARATASQLWDNWDVLGRNLDFGGYTLTDPKLGVHGLDAALHEADARVFKRVPTPNRLLERIRDGKLFDAAERALKNMVMAPEEGGLRDNLYQAKIREFYDRTGKVPTREELMATLPRESALLANLLHISDSIPAKDPWYLKLFGATLRKVWTPEVFQTVRERVDTVLNNAHEAAAALAVSHKEWGVKRARLEVLAKAGANAARVSRDRVQTAIAGLDGLLAAEPASPLAAEWRLRRNAYTEALPALEADVAEGAKVVERLRTHPSDRPWTDGLPENVTKHLNNEALYYLLDSHRELFSGLVPEAVFDTTPPGERQGTTTALKKVITDLDGAVDDLHQKMDAARRAPLNHDDILHHIQESGNRQPEAARGPWTEAAARREKALLDGTAMPTKFHDMAAFQAELRSRRRAAQQLLKDHAEPRGDLTMNPEGAQLLRDMIDHRGVVDYDSVIRTRALSRQLTAAAGLNARGNPFALAATPFVKKAMWLNQMSSRMAGLLAAREAQIAEWSKAVDKLSVRERRLLGIAQRTGQLPSGILERHPVFRTQFGQEAVNAMDDLYRRESASYTQVIEALHDEGMISHAYYNELRKDGYDPQRYAVHERAKLVRSAEVQAMATGERGARGALPSPVGGQEFKFRRDFNGWRLRVDEPGAIVDKVFDTKEEAVAFLRDTYRMDPADLSGPESVITGKTKFDDSFTLAAPIKQREREILGYLGKDLTPEKRLQALSELWTDYYAKKYVDAVNLYGGLVIDDQTFNALPHTRWTRSQFTRAPNVPSKFGTLAGQWVHKRVWAEMGSMRRLSTSLAGFVDGLREELAAMSGAKNPIPATIAERTAALPGGRFFQAIDNVVKNTQILWSHTTWMANMAFDVILDHMAGTQVFDARKTGNLWTAVKDTLPLRGETRDKIYYQALEDGVIAGGLFSDTNGALRKTWSRALGLTGKKSELAALLAERRKALAKVYATTEYRTSADLNTTKLEQEIAAIETRLDDVSGGLPKRILHEVLGLVYTSKDTLGRPRSWVNNLMRQLYNQIDDATKLAAYRNLRERMPREQAAWHIKTFFQDYSRVPQGLRESPLSSLVVSFPWELSRLSANYLRYRPSSFLMTAGALAAVNTAQAIYAGVNMERVNEALATRGRVSLLDKARFWGMSLMSWNPKSKDLDQYVSFANYFPIFEQVQGRGALGLAADYWMPPEQRGLGQEALAAGLGFASQFILNRPAISLGVAALGIDPVTGQRIIDRRASPMAHTAQALHLMAEQFVPQILPGGRSWNRVSKALDAGLNPRTERGYQSPGGPTAALLQAGIGVEARGVLPRTVDEALRLGPPGGVKEAVNDRDIILNLTLRAAKELSNVPGQDPEETLVSEAMELRKAFYRAARETKDPAEKAAAMEAFNELVRKQRDQQFGVAEFRTDMTAEQREALLRRLEDIDVLAMFQRQPVDVQAAILANAEAAQVKDASVQELIIRMTTSPEGNFLENQDPQKIIQAIDILDRRAAYPATNPRLAKLASHLRNYVLPLALTAAEGRQIERTATEPMKAINPAIRRYMTEQAMKRQ